MESALKPQRAADVSLSSPPHLSPTSTFQSTAAHVGPLHLRWSTAKNDARQLSLIEVATDWQWGAGKRAVECVLARGEAELLG